MIVAASQTEDTVYIYEFDIMDQTFENWSIPYSLIEEYYDNLFNQIQYQILIGVLGVGIFGLLIYKVRKR